MQAFIRPHRHVILRLPSDALKIVEIIPNTLISIGKYGAFPANLLLGRPLYATYEILEDTVSDGPEPIKGDSAKPTVRLRIVPASELNQEATFDTAPQASEGDVGSTPEDDSGSATPVAIVRNNQHTVDDSSRQTLSMTEIETLKKAVTGNGREIIEKILSSHKNLDEKTVFSLAKYILRKAKKYLRRFTVLPLDPGRLAQFMTWDRDAARIMELREEGLGLITAWSNVHLTPGVGGGRWLVVDDTGGLIVAALAEKLGILYPHNDESDSTKKLNGTHPSDDTEDTPMTDAASSSPQTTKRAPPRYAPVAASNTLHLLHPASQPNISLLKYFGYDASKPDSTHPLASHLLPLSWLQLLHPDEDATYTEPPVIPQPELEKLKSAKRSTYHRKRRRWMRCREIVDGARAGGFDGLVAATSMSPASYLRHLVPLVKGGGHVVLYSPTLERLSGTIDLYSRERRAAYLEVLERRRERGLDGEEGVGGEGEGEEEEELRFVEEDFPVDPRLLLGCSIQTSRARQWQVLPGRTHPVMTARGGGEGYVFTARRVIPFEGKVEARGNFSKKRKAAPA